MVSKVKGSSIDLGNLGIAYSIVDYGGRITNTAEQNNTAIASALTSIAAAGGGVLVLPHGISHSFNTATDFPVSANALMVWEITGNKFKIYSNQNIDGDMGDAFAAAFFTTPSAVEYQIVDANPPTYTYKFKVYDGAISGSSFDLCWFLPGGVSPVAALARNGANLGALHLFNGLVVKGQPHHSRTIQVPAAAGSYQIPDGTEFTILNHTATIASFTLTLPQNPQDGNTVEIFSLNIITALTLNAGTGETIETGHGITTLGAAASVKYVYHHATTKWYRVK